MVGLQPAVGCRSFVVAAAVAGEGEESRRELSLLVLSGGEGLDLSVSSVVALSQKKATNLWFL